MFHISINIKPIIIIIIYLQKQAGQKIEKERTKEITSVTLPHGWSADRWIGLDPTGENKTRRAVWGFFWFCLF
jgi:hypothetical protein